MLVLPLGICWIGAALLLFFDGRKRLTGWLAVLLLAAALAATGWLASRVLAGDQLTTITGGWPQGIGIRLRADLLSLTFAGLAQAVLLAALLYEVIGGVRERFFAAGILFTAAGLTGLFFTGDAFNFYVFFEVSMTAAFLLTSYGQERRSLRAALVFTSVNLIGSTIFLIAVAGLYRVTGTLDMAEIAARIPSVDPGVTLLIAATILSAFSIKLGLFPFQFWLPMVYRDTAPVVAAVLSAAIANIAAYGLLRFGVDILPRERAMGAWLLLLLAAASILYGAYQAVNSRPSSEMLAYSSVSQAGYIMLALGIGGQLGVAALVIYAVINSLNKTLLFLATGLRGPAVAGAFAIGAFSVAGVPPAAGFFGKAALFRASVAIDSAILAGLVFLGGALAFVYMFQAYQRDYWQQAATRPASPLAGRVLLAGLAGIILLLGVWPQPLLQVSEAIGLALGGGAS